jgi:hypothetical protein
MEKASKGFGLLGVLTTWRGRADIVGETAARLYGHNTWIMQHSQIRETRRRVEKIGCDIIA